MAKILITGGSGLLGRHLCRVLQAKGFEIAILSRTKIVSPYEVFIWHPEKNTIDENAVRQVDYIIHLAGANISEKRWTKTRKQEIIDSRVSSANLIFKTLKAQNTPIKAFISASGIGYYGTENRVEILSETDTFGTDFLAQTCVQWERAAAQFASLNARVVKIRTGIILEKTGGILAKLQLPIKLGIASPFGNGQQILPWIHIHDICAIYLQAIEDNQMEGSYNAVSPEFTNNKDFVKTCCKVFNRPMLMPAIPAFLLKWLFGEMAVVFLTGSKMATEKILKTGFKFKFTNLELALIDLLKSGTG